MVLIVFVSTVSQVSCSLSTCKGVNIGKSIASTDYARFLTQCLTPIYLVVLFCVCLVTKRGELGFFRIELGKNLLGIESHISWAVPGSYSVTNFPCLKDGSNCMPKKKKHESMTTTTTEYFIDPSKHPERIMKQRLRQASAAGSTTKQ